MVVYALILYDLMYLLSVFYCVCTFIMAFYYTLNQDISIILDLCIINGPYRSTIMCIFILYWVFVIHNSE